MYRVSWSVLFFSVSESVSESPGVVATKHEYDAESESESESESSGLVR